MNLFFSRMIRAARLEADFYEEVEADKTALTQAMVVVILSSLAAGIGSYTGQPLDILAGLAGTLGGWLIWAFITYFVGTRILPQKQTEADYGQLLRTIGFSSSPGLIRVFGFYPPLRGILFLVASIWMLAAMVVAVRQALDYTGTPRAVGVVFIGWIIQAVIIFLILTLVTPAN
ncbi:MAG: YIP1 family protein [Chitinispirillaceae bacterium]